MFLITHKRKIFQVKMPRYETCWLINKALWHSHGRYFIEHKSFHLFLVYSVPTSLWRSRRVKILNTNWRDCRHQSSSSVWVTFFGVDPVKRLLWGVQVCVLRLSPSILWFMMTARTWMWSSWVFSVKSLHVLRSVCLGLPSVRSSHNLSAWPSVETPIFLRIYE